MIQMKEEGTISFDDNYYFYLFIFVTSTILFFKFIYWIIKNRLELVFAEERKRASERIISLTKSHEQKMKNVIIAMDLSG